MKILVTAKRVIDPEVKIKVLGDGSGIDKSGLNYKMNYFDEIAIEEALRIKEKNNAEVVTVTIGPADSQSVIRGGLAMGADRAILVSHEGEDLDPDTIARLLRKVVESENPDLVLMGKQATDDDSNQVGQLLAEYLGWGQACFASKVELGDGAAKVSREVDGGIETLEVKLPAIVTADLRLNEPRYASLKNIMAAKKKELKEIPADSLGVDLTPRIVMKNFRLPPARGGGKKVPDVASLVKALREEAKAL
ncbi:MAG: Electron transfer flavoprotein subunit beta [Myxococcota bacterium]|nr:Electron transfer flavoprotein subunit beta [Myxococcota bacterium]